MKKNKKNKASKKAGLLGGAAKSLKKLGQRTGIGRLSTAQKVVGGATLVALGVRYLARHRRATSEAVAAPPADVAGAEQNLATM